jgi:hypothetical protein
MGWLSRSVCWIGWITNRALNEIVRDKLGLVLDTP